MTEDTEATANKTAFTTLSALTTNPETAKLLGNLTVAWSHAERVFYFVFWVASGTTQPKAFEIYERIPNFRTRYELGIELLNKDRSDHPGITKLMTYLQTLLQCFQLRNDLTHRTWVSDRSGNLGLIDHRLKKNKPAVRPVADSDIQTLIATINSTCDDIITTIHEIYPHAFREQ